MKVINLICILAFMFLICGCSIDKQDTVTGSDQEECIVQYIETDFQTFLDDWKSACGDTTRDVLLAPDSKKPNATLTIPILQSNDYSFSYVEVNDTQYMYFFTPIDSRPEDILTYADVFGIYVSKVDNSFDIVMKQHDLTPVNGIAYSAERNAWYIDNNGRRIRIEFPDTIVLESADQLSEYFTFEEYGSRNEK